VYHKILSTAESLIAVQQSSRFQNLDIFMVYDDGIAEVKPDETNPLCLAIHLPTTFNLDYASHRALLAHEVVHTLRPAFDSNNIPQNTYLEEGLAVWFQYHYLQQETCQQQCVEYAQKDSPERVIAYNSFMEASKINKNFIKNILHNNNKRICDITEFDLVNECLGLEAQVVDKLIGRF